MDKTHSSTRADARTQSSINSNTSWTRTRPPTLAGLLRRMSREGQTREWRFLRTPDGVLQPVAIDPPRMPHR